jgi:hypothetical protein
MAGKRVPATGRSGAVGRFAGLRTIDLVDLTWVFGGLDKQTTAAQQGIQAATTAMEDLARITAPKDNSMTQMIMQMMGSRRGGAGPAAAPALPPTSTLTR